MATRQLLIASAAVLLGGCFPEFATWHEGGGTTSAESSSGTGGAGSSTSSSTGGSGGAGGGAPTCEELGGQCHAPIAGFSGPASMSATGCGGLSKVLAMGTNVATEQTGVCHFAAIPDECTAPQILIPKNANCDIWFGSSYFTHTPDMNVCEAGPPNDAVAFKVTASSRADCKVTGVLPAVAFDEPLDLCEAPGTCSNGDRCVTASAAKVCVWVETDNLSQCPTGYPDMLKQETADPNCASNEDATCTPNLVVAPDCMLNDQVKSASLAYGECKPWPGADAVWALKPGTVEACADKPMSKPTSRTVTLCCTQP